MTGHRCKAYARATGQLVLDGSGGAVDQEYFEFDRQELTGGFECSCGKSGMSREEAEQHIQEATADE